MTYRSKTFPLFLDRDESNIGKEIVLGSELRRLAENLSEWITLRAAQHFQISADHAEAIWGLVYDPEDRIQREYDLSPETIQYMRGTDAFRFFSIIDPAMTTLLTSEHATQLDNAMETIESTLQRYCGESVLFELKNLVTTTRDAQVEQLASYFHEQPLKPKPIGEVRHFPSNRPIK